MNMVLFDNGGTIINDPFDATLSTLKNDILNKRLDLSIPGHLIDELFSIWTFKNKKIDYPFASHFMQEEVWIAHALIKLAVPTF